MRNPFFWWTIFSWFCWWLQQDENSFVAVQGWTSPSTSFRSRRSSSSSFSSSSAYLSSSRNINNVNNNNQNQQNNNHGLSSRSRRNQHLLQKSHGRIQKNLGHTWQRCPYRRGSRQGLGILQGAGDRRRDGWPHLPRRRPAGCYWLH